MHCPIKLAWLLDSPFYRLLPLPFSGAAAAFPLAPAAFPFAPGAPFSFEGFFVPAFGLGSTLKKLKKNVNRVGMTCSRYKRSRDGILTRQEAQNNLMLLSGNCSTLPVHSLLRHILSRGLELGDTRRHTLGVESATSQTGVN